MSVLLLGMLEFLVAFWGRGEFLLQEIDAPVLSNMLSWAVFPSLMLRVEPRALYMLSKCFTVEPALLSLLFL